jgi:pyruvate/2-oxoglutarate dehydrogenase complex dihydrolipoamide acyltransferase (E2) component
MLRIGAVALAVLAAGVGAVAVSAAPAGDWSRYQNERFGFRLEYPANLFHVERTTEAGDGRVFAARDGQARLLVGALSNQDHHSAKSYQDFLARTSYANYTITNRPLGDDWLVLSGEADGTIFYEKAILSCGGALISSFALLYPADKRDTYEPILARIANSFVPSSKPCRAGPGNASARQRPATRSPQAEASTRAPRALRTARAARQHNEALTRAHGYGPLADQIARERGSDVIVIMRRTTPPYDYKYVRGYATR